MQKICAGVSLLCLAAVCAAQDSRGTIFGRVTDSSGAVLASAKVRATNVKTNVTFDVGTNESGVFTIPYVLPGFYNIAVQLAGFKKLDRNDVEVRIDETVSLSFALPVGDVTESIEVTAGAPLLATEDASLGQVVDERRMVDLPIASGNAAELTLLAPGTVNGTDLRSRKAAFNNAPSQFSTDGGAIYSNEFSIDGVPNTFASGISPRIAFSPPQGAISAFKVETSSYDASLGHTPGSVVNLITASGTNRPHGEVHEFLANSALDAPTFFQNRARLKKPVYQDNRYGGTFGGPVMLPKLYDGRNKTFFLYTFEGNKWGTPVTGVYTVPTDAEKNGDFSALLKLGSQYQIYDPFTTKDLGTGRFSRQPIAGNIIPPGRLDPVARKITPFWPEPNTPGTASGQNNYTLSYRTKENYFVNFLRVDHNFSEKNRMFLRLDYDNWVEIKNDLYFNIATGITTGRTNRGMALDDVHVLSPTTVLNVRYGLTQQEFPEVRQSRGIDLASLGFSPGLTSLIPKPLASFPVVGVGGFSGFGAAEAGDGTNTSLVHSLTGSLNTLLGKHSLHYGVDARLYRAFQNRFTNDISPNFSFGTGYTRGPLDNSTAAPLGQELATFLLGIPEGQMTRSSSYADQEIFLGFFLQDSWKVTPKLTLSFGLRLERETPETERYDRFVKGFDYAAVNPIQAQALANYSQSPIPELPVSNFKVLGGLRFGGGSNGREFWSGQAINFLPRIGIAYQLDTKTVIRTGYGIFYDTLGTNRSPAIQTGFTASTPITASYDSGQTYVATLANPFPTGLLSPLGASGGLSTNLGQNLSVYPAYRPLPYAQRWSFDLQRQLPLGFLLDAAYVGNRGTRLAINRELNYTPQQYLSRSRERDQPTIDFLSQQSKNPFFGINSIYGGTISRANLLKPYPEFGNVQETEPVGYSWYHALQTQIVKRFSQGYTLNVAYTWSKSMDATQFLNVSDPTPWRGISTLDRTHRLVISGIWELPAGRGRAFASGIPKWLDYGIGSWQVSTVIARQSGAPLGWGDIIFRGDIKDIPLSKDQRNVDQWFNVNAGFERNSAKQLGSDIRTWPLRFSGIRGDGQAKWDFSAVKYFPIGEQVRLQLRADCYNALNHPNLTDPNLGVTGTAFGTITSQNGQARSFQLSARISF